MATVAALSHFFSPPETLPIVCALVEPALKSQVRERARARGLRVRESSWRAAHSNIGTEARLLVLADCSPCDGRAEWA